MLHTNLIKIGLICAIAFAGCGGTENDEDLASQTSESSVKVLDLNLIGTFISDSKRAGDLEQLVLKTNGTFHAATVVECFAPPCNPVQQDGAYAISWRDSRRYITLYNPDDTIMGRYQYEWQDSSLRLLKVNRGGESMPDPGWLQMWLSTTAWCAASSASAPPGSAPSDCQLQNLPIGPCGGQWSCVSNACQWDCGAVR